MYAQATIEGIGFGIMLAMAIGPVFFALLQTSMRMGKESGAIMAVGIFLSDLLYIFVAYIGVSFLEEHAKEVHIWLGLAGGILLIIFGIVTFFKRITKYTNKENNVVLNRNQQAKLIVKGFIINAISPFVPFFWVGTVGIVSLKPDYEMTHHLTFFTALLITTYCTDFTKSWLAATLSRYLTSKVLTQVNRIAGLLLVGFGIYLLAHGLNEALW
jgi:threonine/homoserine/homoserine lactone efflux protein